MWQELIAKSQDQPPDLYHSQLHSRGAAATSSFKTLILFYLLVWKKDWHTETEREVSNSIPKISRTARVGQNQSEKSGTPTMCPTKVIGAQALGCPPLPFEVHWGSKEKWPGFKLAFIQALPWGCQLLSGLPNLLCDNTGPTGSHFSMLKFCWMCSNSVPSQLLLAGNLGGLKWARLFSRCCEFCFISRKIHSTFVFSLFLLAGPGCRVNASSFFLSQDLPPKNKSEFQIFKPQKDISALQNSSCL